MKIRYFNTVTTFLFASFCLVMLGSCKKEGCTDKKATNYNSNADKDNGSCKYKKSSSNEAPNQVSDQLPNSDFENWENVGSPTEEPIRWSSLKTADALASAAPKVIERDAGHTGNYGVKLTVSDPVFNIEANGLLTTGRVHADYDPEKGYVYTDVSDPQWNTPFNARPDSLVGWYKYSPQPGDKGKIEVLLHKGTHARLPRDQETINNEIGDAAFKFITAKTDWTRFSVPFHYTSTEDIDYVLGVIQAGDSTISQTGTKLWVDDIKLIYNN